MPGDKRRQRSLHIGCSKRGGSSPIETPVLGYPWQIPLEFPIFQTIVAFVVWLGDLPLDPTGRIISLVFLLACAWPAFQIALRLRLPPEAPWLFCALLWSAPIYIFNGRSFLIETAAIFFVFAAIPYAIDLREARPSVYSGIVFALLASLGMLQKVSTAFPILCGLILIFLILHIREHGLHIPDTRRIHYIRLSFHGTCCRHTVVVPLRRKHSCKKPIDRKQRVDDC